jgi:hypothetical protein
MSFFKSEWLVHSFIVLCCGLMLPSLLFGQEYPAKRDNASGLQHAGEGIRLPP